ncbi:MAG: hypothetical protein NT007_11145 [Candidatus Kapabacteria bacterium]|nr:hypothetical protein [Candidatus Kapabacteria bacterium]
MKKIIIAAIISSFLLIIPTFPAIYYNMKHGDNSPDIGYGGHLGDTTYPDGSVVVHCGLCTPCICYTFSNGTLVTGIDPDDGHNVNYNAVFIPNLQ